MRRIHVILIIAAIAGGGAVFWHKVGREQFFPKNFGVVEDGRVYRSGRLTSAMLRKVIDEHGIKTVINLDMTAEPDVLAQEASTVAETGADRMCFDLIGDGRGDPASYAEVVALMADPARQPVLVHCAAGAQRTTTAVLLYEHLVRGRPIQEVYADSFDYKHRPDEWVLLAYLADNMDEIRALVEPKLAPPVAEAAPPAPPTQPDRGPP